MRATMLLLTSVCLLTTNGSPPSPSIVMDGECVRVIDGDTIVVRSSVVYRVRLLDCWAPESRTKNAEEKTRGYAAKNRMVELAEGKTVRVEIPLGTELSQSTTMGRVLGRAWLNVDGIPDSQSLSEIMVSEGHATVTKGEK